MAVIVSEERAIWFLVHARRWFDCPPDVPFGACGAFCAYDASCASCASFSAYMCAIDHGGPRVGSDHQRRKCKDKKKSVKSVSMLSGQTRAKMSFKDWPIGKERKSLCHAMHG